MSKRAIAIVTVGTLALAYLGYRTFLCSGDRAPGEPDSRQEEDSRLLTHDPAPPVLSGRTDAAGPSELASSPRAVPSLVGTLLDSEDKPIADSTIELKRHQPKKTGRAIKEAEVERNLLATCKTDEAGRFRWDEIEAGSYEISAPTRPGWIAPVAVVMVAGTDVERNLKYRLPVTVNVRVLNEDDEPVEHADVNLYANHRRVAQAWTGPTGTARFSDLDPEQEMTLGVGAPGLAGTSIRPWPVRDTRIVLHPWLHVKGRVVNERGEPVPYAYIYRHEGRRRITTKAKADGTFHVGMLCYPGPVTLEPCPPGRLPAAKPKLVTAETGAEDVVLVVPSGQDLPVEILNWEQGFNAWISLLSVEGDDRIHAMVSPDGHAVLPHVVPGKEYVLWCSLNMHTRKREENRYLYAPSVTVQDGPLSLRLQEGEVITARVVNPYEDIRILGVGAGGQGVRARGHYYPDQGVWRIPGLPPGRWTVSSSGGGDQCDSARVLDAQPPTHRASTEAETGDTVELTLEPVDDE